MEERIYPGQLWLDTSGKPIQAHGFSVFYSEMEGVFYWYGENKEKTVGGPDNTIWHWGVRCYRSEDLCSWDDMGLIIPPAPEDLYSPLHPTYCMDRPHILYCPNTGKYVAWLKIMCDATSQFMTVLQADSFLGPYEIVRDVYKPLGMDTGDFALAESGGKAYFIFDRPHFELVTATLDDSYTGVTGEYSVHYEGRKPPECREAPTVFTRNGKHYLFTSGTTGYYPNQTEACVFDDFHGEYRSLGDPCEGDDTGTTFHSLITCVLKLPGKDAYIACADRWIPETGSAEEAARELEAYRERFADYVPDTSCRTAGPLPGALQHHPENTSVSRYVWLPVHFEGEKPVIRWQNAWSPKAVFENT